MVIILTFESDIRIGDDVITVTLTTDKLKSDIDNNRSYLYEIGTKKQAVYSDNVSPYGLSSTDNIMQNESFVKYTADCEYGNLFVIKKTADWRFFYNNNEV